MTRTLMTMLAVVTGALVLVASGLGRSNAVPALRGTVGPGFTINLTKRGKKVKNLKGGTYRFAISDRSAAHNFVLERERGVEKRLTTVAFSGTKTVTLKLTRGSWKFYCEPHQSMMFGRFTVGGASTAAAAAPGRTTAAVTVRWSPVTTRAAMESRSPATTAAEGRGNSEAEHAS